jgi:hypothetical protein
MRHSDYRTDSRVDKLAQLKRFLQKARVVGSITRVQARILEEVLTNHPELEKHSAFEPVIRELRSFPIHENPIRHLRILPALVIIPLAVFIGACEDTTTSRDEWPDSTCAVAADYESMECTEEGQ